LLRVEVEWTDSGSMIAGEQWMSTQHVKERGHVGPVITTGQLLLFSDDVTLVGLSFDEENDAWFGVQAIDTRAIKKISILRSRKDYTPDMFDELAKRVV